MKYSNNDDSVGCGCWRGSVVVGTKLNSAVREG